MPEVSVAKEGSAGAVPHAAEGPAPVKNRRFSRGTKIQLSTWRPYGFSNSFHNAISYFKKNF